MFVCPAHRLINPQGLVQQVELKRSLKLIFAHFAPNSNQPTWPICPVLAATLKSLRIVCVISWFDPCLWSCTNIGSWLHPHTTHWQHTSTQTPSPLPVKATALLPPPCFCKNTAECRGSKQWYVQSIEEMGIKNRSKTYQKCSLLGFTKTEPAKRARTGLLSLFRHASFSRTYPCK